MVRKYTSRRARTTVPLILGSLLLINAGVAHFLIDQLTVSADASTQVKGVETVLPEEAAVEETGTDDHDLSAISIYTVKSGDTISGIATKFGITTGTIYAANDLSKNQVLKVGAELVILPITGIQYTVKSGDTISGIATKFDVPAADILDFNDIENASKIRVGMDLIIPNAETYPVEEKQPEKPKVAAVPAAKPTTTPVATTPATTVEDDDHDKEETVMTKTPAAKSGIFANPAPGSVLTQGLHAVNAVDFGASVGTSILAAAKGTVIVAKGNGGYNGGFGNFIVITHGDGIQTLYAHLSKVEVAVGDTVDQGEKIGRMGSTGKSTGSHLHFEVHGAKNPWIGDKKYTKY